MSFEMSDSYMYVNTLNLGDFSLFLHAIQGDTRFTKVQFCLVAQQKYGIGNNESLSDIHKLC